MTGTMTPCEQEEPVNELDEGDEVTWKSHGGKAVGKPEALHAKQ